MTMLASATGLGYALGSSLAGRLADTSGATAAFGVTVGATVLAVVLMTSQQRRLRTATAAAEADQPTVQSEEPVLQGTSGPGVSSRK
jgi:MFS family permease